MACDSCEQKKLIQYLGSSLLVAVLILWYTFYNKLENCCDLDLKYGSQKLHLQLDQLASWWATASIGVYVGFIFDATNLDP
jgi:hypothetical protein